MYIGQCLLPDDKIKSLAKDLSEDTTLGLSYEDALSEIKDKFNVVFSKLKIPEEIWNEDFFEPYKDIVLNRVKDLITIDGALIDYNFINDPKLKLDINVFLANKLIESFNSKVREADDFKESHIYEIKQGDNWVKADISVTSYAKEIKDEKDLNKAKPFKISQYKKEDVVPNAGMVIGNTFDSIARDFFSGEDITKKSYPNIDSRRLKELKTELENVKTYFDRIYKGKYKVIARPFPIASTFTDSTGKKFTIAGETDLMVVTPNGIKIYDFKVNSSKSDIELVDTYTNQLSLYKRIINDEMPFLNVDTGGLIVADINYYKTRGILKIKDGIITYKDKNISSLKEDDYSIHLHQSIGFMQKSPIVSIMYNKKVIENIGRLSDEELEELKKIPMFGELDIDELSKKGKIEQKKREDNLLLNENNGLVIKQDDKSYYRGQYEEPIIDKDGNLILRGRKDDLYIRAGYNIDKGVSATTDLTTAREYGETRYNAYIADVEDKYGELDNSWEKEDEINEVMEHGYYLIQFPKSVTNKIIKESGEVKLVGDVVIPKGTYSIQHITNDNIETIATATNIEDTAQKQILDKQEVKQWNRYSNNGFEVSRAAGKNGIIGDSRFSAFNATFKPNTIIDGVEVGGKTIEYVYQNVIKKSGKGQAPAEDSKLYKPYNTKNEIPFIRQLALLGRQPVISTDFDYILEADKKRDDINKVTKRSPSYNIFKDLINLFKFPDVNIDKLAVSENTKSKIYDAQRTIKNAKSYDQTKLIRISDKEAKELAEDFYNIQKLHTDIMKIIVKEVWGLTMKTSPSTFSAKDLTPEGDSLLLQTKEDKEDFSYYVGYLPLWQEWAKQNPELIEELREKSKGKVLTDKFANTRVSQARALADILNNSTKENKGFKISISTEGYRKGDPQKNPDINYVFTENAQAYVWATHNDDFAADVAEYIEPKLNVSDVNGTNQAGIRTDAKGNISPNAYGIVVKKYQQDANGKFVAKEGQFQDTDEDFNLFTALNKDMFNRLSKSPNKEIKFPSQMALGKAALPLRFAKWLQNELSTRFDIDSTIEKNTKAGYEGYGLKIGTKQSEEKNTTSVTKIISGGQTGVDTIGLQVAKELGIETGGTAPKGFRRETGIDNEDISSYNLVEITDEEQADYTKRKGKRDYYTGRTELNVRNSDGTVYFYTSNDKTGMLATQRSAKEWNKPFIVNPSVEQLRDWIIENDIKVLNVAGNRGSKLSKDNNVAEVLRKALTYSKESEDSTVEEEEIDNPFEGLLEEDNSEDTNEDDEELEGSTEEVSTIDTSPNLLPVTSTEIIKCGQNVAKLVAYHINILRADDNYREELFGDKFPEGYFLGKSNNEIVTDTDAFKAILDFIKDDTFNIDDIDFDSPLFDKVNWVLDNWDSVIKAGFSTFVDVLNISIDASVSADDETNNEDLNSDQNEDSSDDVRAAWSYDIREVSPSKSMNANLKIQLCTIPEYSYSEGVDSNDNPVMIRESLQYDEGALNSVKFLDRNTIIYTLFNELHSFRRFSEMKAALGSFELQSKYPWMQDVYDLLDNNPDLETLFFTTFRTNKLNYINTSVQEIEQEKGTTLEINSYPLADNITFETILSQVSDGINKGESELFTINGNNGLSLLNAEENESLFNAYEHIKRPRKSDKSSKKVRMIRYIKRYCQSLGFNESFIEIISPALKKEKDSNLNNIVDALEQSRKSIAEKASTKRGFIPYVNFSREFYHIVKTIEPYYPIQNELSGYNNGKSYQTFVPPSYLGDLIDKLSNGTDDEIRAFIREEFGQSFQTALFNEDGVMTGSPNYWLNEIYKNPELGRQMVHYVEVESQGKQYKDLTSAEYQLSLFINYLTPMGFPGTSKEELTRLKAKYKGSYARFRVPIMSDKSTSEYILFEKIPINAERNAEQMKKEICKALFPMFFTELMRIKHTFENNLDIENYNVPIPEDIKEKFENGKLTLKDFVTKDKKTGKPKLQSWVQGGLAFRNFDIIVPSFISNENKEFTKAIIQIINSKNTTSATYKKSKQALIDNFDKVLIEAIDNRLKTVFIPHLFSIGVDFSKIEKLISVSEVSSEDLNNFLTEYYWNDFLASTCIQNMTIIDQAFYKDAVAIQKRMAQIHSMTTRPNTEATFIDDNGNRVRLSDGKQRVLIVEDEFSASSIAESVKTVFEGLAKDAENDTKREEYLRLSVEIPKKLSNINVTDGQALSTISGMFKKYGMLYGVSPSLKRAYDKIRTGHFDREDIEQFIDGYYSDYTTSFGIIKPFTFAKVNAGTAENPLIDNLQIKDSECMLALSGALLNTYSKEYLPESSPLRALYEIVEDSFYDEDGQWTGKGIDTIVFRSCVKMGSFKVLKDISKSADPRKDIREYLRDPHSIKVFDFDKWGKQQNTPDELRDHEQDMGSQERVLSVSDFDNSDVFTIKGNKKTLFYREFLNDYFKLLEEDFNDGIDNIIEKFKIHNSYTKRVHRLSEYLKSQILKDSKFTFENFKAVSLNNGEFTIPIGDPSLSDKFLTSLYAEVKRNVNKEKMLGGPTVQVSCYGLEGLEIHINSKTKSLEYIDIAMTCPSDELEAKLTKPDGSLMSVEEALKKKLITEDDLKAIITRIPTEDKYSILPCRVKFFLPRHSGDRVIFPKEITYLTGSDFDVDKGYIQLKYTINNFGKLFETQRRKNKIFEYQWAALTHPKSFEKMIYGQDFGFLKDIAEDIDPNFKSADINMSFAESQSYFMEKNMYAKKLVAISAVHNISHSIANFADLYIKIPDVSINGIRTSTLFDDRGYFRIDKTYSDFNSSRISRTIASLLGAAVDNAKELIVATIGYNDMTANIFLTMVRAGIPIDFVCYLFANKTIQNIANRAKIDGTSFISELSSFLDGTLKTPTPEAKNTFISNILDTTNFSTDMLKENINGENEALTIKSICLISSFYDASEGIRRFTTISSLNSTKNAVGSDVFDTIKKEFTIKEIIEEMKGNILYDETKDTIFPDDTYDKLIKNVSYLEPLIKCYTSITPKLLKDNFMQYQAPFRGLLQHLALGHDIRWSNISSKKLKSLFNQFCIYMASKDALDCSYSNRKAVLLEAPLNFLKLRIKNNVSNDLLSSLVIGDRISRKIGIPNMYMKTAKLSSDIKDALSSSWSALVRTPETKKISDLLINYNIFRYGFRFSPTGFLNIAPNDSKLRYGKEGDWYKMTNHKGVGDLEVEDYENFLMQYIRNNPYSSLVGTFSMIPDVEENVKWNSSRNEFSVNLDFVGDVLALRPKKTGVIYLLTSKDPATNKAHFKKVTTLGLKGQGFEYNAKEDFDKITTVNSSSNIRDLLEKFKSTKEVLENIKEDEEAGESTTATPSNPSRFLNAGEEITESKDKFSVFNDSTNGENESDVQDFINLTDSDEFYEESLEYGATKETINKITNETDSDKRIKLVNKMLNSFTKKLGEDKVNKSEIFTEVKEAIKKFC